MFTEKNLDLRAKNSMHRIDQAVPKHTSGIHLYHKFLMENNKEYNDEFFRQQTKSRLSDVQKQLSTF